MAVYSEPLSVPAPPQGTDRNNIVATSQPVQLGGVAPPNPDDTQFAWTTAPAAPGQVTQVVLSGQGISLNVGTGAAVINAIGSGLIVESVQRTSGGQGDGTTPVPDAGKYIQLGDPSVGYNFTPINTDFQVSGNTVGQKESISEAAGGLVPAGGFGFYVHGGTGNDTLVGSTFSDFIRGGAGDDAINAGNGDDVVRGGDGSDGMTLGAGADVVYYTPDQVVGSDLDVVTDFRSGVDRVKLSEGISYEISADRRSVILTNSSDPGSQTVIRSELDIFRDSDVSFVV